MALKIGLLSQISRILRGNRRAEPQADLKGQNVEVAVLPIWETTGLPSVIKEVSAEAAQLDHSTLLRAAENEIREAKAAHGRRASVSSVQRLYRAQAYRMIARVPDSPELISNLAWQLSEQGNYAAAAAIGRYAYELSSQSGAAGAGGMPAFKLAVYEFHLGNLAASREWLDRVPREMRNWSDYVAFEKRVKLCEEARQSLSAAWNGKDDYESLKEQSEFSLSQQQPSSALRLMHQAFQAAQKSNNKKHIYDAQFGIARILYDQFRFFSESSSWYFEAFRTAVEAETFAMGAEALLKGAHAHLETGNRAVTADIIRHGLEEVGSRVEGLIISNLYAVLAFAVSDQDPTLSRRHLTVATEHLANVGPEDVLDWALAYGRLFVRREKQELAFICFRATNNITDTSYYSPRVSSVFRELAHLYFLQEKWTTCLLILNESRNRSYLNNDVEGVCAALLHAAQVYKSANERGVAAKTIQTAMIVGRDRILDQKLQKEIAALWGKLNLELDPLTEQDSGWNAALQEILSELPGSRVFNDAFGTIRRDVRQIESIKDLEPYFDSESFRFPFIIRAYGVALDRSGDQPNARNYLMRAYRMHRGMKDYPEAASTLHEYAVACARLTQYHTAKRAFLIALTLKRRYGSSSNSPADSLFGFVQASIAVRSTKGLAECLSELLKEGESNRSMWSGPEAFDIRSVQLVAADGHLLLGNTQEADRLAAEVKSSIPKPPPENFNPSLLLQMARFELDRKRPSESLNYARQAMDLLERARPKVVGPQHRTELQRYEMPAASALIEAAYELGTTEAEHALRSTEFVRVRSLLERFGRTRVPYPSGFPDELRVRDKELRAATDNLLDELRGAPSGKREQLTAKLADIELMEQSFIQAIPKQFESYANLRSGVPLDPSEIVKKCLGSSDSEVLALFPSHDATFVWHLDRGGNTKGWYRTPTPIERINLLRQSLEAEVSRREWTAASLDDLASTLLDDCLRSINPGTTLCIVGGGSLLQIPLSAARVRDGGYLCERHPVAFLPSFSLAGFWDSRERAARPASVFADSLGDLLYARKEAEFVSKRFNCKQLRGKDVTRQSILSAMSSCDLLHLACHADYDSNDPLNSGIRLASGQRLTCRDLMTVSTRARFAFLSACETGRLSVRSGDELEGLTSSVMYSGFEAVVGSLWRVPDRETRRLVEVFYEHSQNGENLAHCLQAAQLHVLGNKMTSSPYFWGAWQVVGNWKPTLI